MKHGFEQQRIDTAGQFLQAMRAEGLQFEKVLSYLKFAADKSGPQVTLGQAYHDMEEVYQDFVESVLLNWIENDFGPITVSWKGAKIEFDGVLKNEHNDYTFCAGHESEGEVLFTIPRQSIRSITKGKHGKYGYETLLVIAN